MELFCRNCSGDPFVCCVDKIEEGLNLRVEFEKGGFGNPTRKEGKALFLKRLELELEVEGESEENEEDIIEIEEVNTIFGDDDAGTMCV